jgi:hypothetical protein
MLFAFDDGARPPPHSNYLDKFMFTFFMQNRSSAVLSKIARSLCDVFMGAGRKMSSHRLAPRLFVLPFSPLRDGAAMQ